MNQENSSFLQVVQGVVLALSLPFVLLAALVLLVFGIAAVLAFRPSKSEPSYCIPDRDKPYTCVDISEF